MKVLQIVKTSEGANWAFEQAKELAKRDIEIVTIVPDINGVIAKKYIENGMKLIEEDFSLPINKPWKIFERRKKIHNIIKIEKPDIIHMHFVTNAIMLRLALKKETTPRLFQVPGPLHLESKFFKNLDIKTSRENDYWAPSCKKSKELYLNENIDKEKVFLAYYGGYGGEKIAEYSTPKGVLKKQYNIKEDTILVGMVSYFYKPKWYLGQKRGIKGHEDFIDAIKILEQKYKNIKAIIIGGPWGNSQKYENKVKEYASKIKCENIIFTGFRTDIKEIYKELDIAVHPSHSENLGGAAESLAASVPTIATNIGGFPDIVIDGETGYLCEIKNPIDLAKKIEKIIQNKGLAKEMAQKGQNKVKEMLDIKNTTTEIIRIYEEILERN